MTSVSVAEQIRAKRDGKELSKDDITNFVSSLGTPALSEAQIGAMLMAIYLNGLTSEETMVLTKAMASSGYNFSWPKEWKGTIVDKHSTGGIGDKVSLALVPALAACGLRVPMISGRGLDFTGGTLDKLESIPGFCVALRTDEIVEMLKTEGCCIVGQTEDLVPADKHLYRIRDVTATVDNENLITASVISKKVAEKLDALVLDIKVGSGAFMKKIEDAESLAKKLVEVGNSFDMKVSAFITRMDVPLGKTIGNALEVAEAIETLKNNGPKDLTDLVVTLGGKLLESTGKSPSFEVGKTLIRNSLENGEALLKFGGLIIGQGVSPTVALEICEGDKWKYLPRAPRQTEIKAESSGYIGSVNAIALGRISHGLGCGRKTPEMPIKYHPGIVLKKTLGDPVTKGDVILEIHHDMRDILNTKIIMNSMKIVPDPPLESELVIKLIE